MMRTSAMQLLHANRTRWIASRTAVPCSSSNSVLNAAIPTILMNCSSSRRWFGGVKTPTTTSVDSHHDDHHGDHHDDDHHHDDHHHKPLGPYEVPHHPTYPKKAYFLGINPNEKYKWEGWEIITYVTYASCFIALVYGYNANNKNSFKEWAREEAIVRNKILANGGSIEFGKWYNVNEFEQDEDDPESTNKPPVLKEKGE